MSAPTDHQIEAAVRWAVQAIRSGDSAAFVASVLRVKVEDAHA